VKLEMRGTAIKVFDDSGSGYGAAILSVTDSDIASAGRTGALNYGDGGVVVDNFTVTNAGGGPTPTRRNLLTLGVGE
jgi:hypothetical protein